MEEKLEKHLRITDPSPWIARFAGLIPQNGSVLDLACGGGRHAQIFLHSGHPVTAIDKNTDAIRDRLGNHENLEIISADLESGPHPFHEGGPLFERSFDGIVVVNYLYRDHLGALLSSLKPGGVLIYETFARGNEDYARPRNPDHLLRAGELLELAQGRLQVVAYEHGLVETGDIPGVKQRIVAVNDLGQSTREDGDPTVHNLSNSYTGLVPELYCSDLQASLEFYVTQIGFSIFYDRPEEKFAYLDLAGVQVMLIEVTEDDDGERVWWTATAEKPYGRGINLQIEVTDVDRIHDQLSKSGWSMYRPMEEKWYHSNNLELGQRQFLVQDPDGYLLRFCSDLGKRPFKAT